jgi:very-short-patch-repair endonuclease
MAFYKDSIKVLEELKEKYPKYDYSKFKYSKMREKCTIICPVDGHGEFYPTVVNFKNGSGCPKCSRKISRTHNKSTTRLTQEEIIKRFKKIHKDKYNYSEIKYINRSTKVKIICNFCNNEFKQIPSSHLKGHGCPKCSKIEASKKRIKNTNNTKNIINEFKKVHGNKYDYSKVNYIDSNTKVEIICPKHQSFFQLPGSHKSGIGCPNCNESKGEERIRKFLEENNISFKQEYIFQECKNIMALPFDFYLPDLNILIEYDGKQHFEPIKHFGGITEFLKTQKRDKIKTKYCENNNINLIRINYKNFENIDQILSLKLQTQVKPYITN